MLPPQVRAQVFFMCSLYLYPMCRYQRLDYIPDERLELVKQRIR